MKPAGGIHIAFTGPHSLSERKVREIPRLPNKTVERGRKIVAQETRKCMTVTSASVKKSEEQIVP